MKSSKTAMNSHFLQPSAVGNYNLMYFAYLHGEGILFGILFAGFAIIIALSFFLYGVLRYRSVIGLKTAVGYLLLAAIPLILLYLDETSVTMWIISALFTIPLSVIVPEWFVRSSGFGITFTLASCTLLNAVVLYFARRGYLGEGKYFRSLP